MNTILYENRQFYTPYDRDELRRKRNLQRKHLQETKRKLFFLIVSIALIIILAVIFGSFRSSANTLHSQPEEYKYFTQYTVSCNETLWEIATQYADSHYDGIHDYIDEVKAMNHIENIDEIRAGSVLLLPYYSTEVLR